MALILALGPISGAHFNPAVTIVEAWHGGLAWREVPCFVAAQIAGAFAGVASAHVMFAERLFSVSDRARAHLVLDVLRKSSGHAGTHPHRYVCRHPAYRRTGVHRGSVCRRVRWGMAARVADSLAVAFRSSGRNEGDAPSSLSGDLQ